MFTFQLPHLGILLTTINSLENHLVKKKGDATTGEVVDAGGVAAEEASAEQASAEQASAKQASAEEASIE